MTSGDGRPSLVKRASLSFSKALSFGGSGGDDTTSTAPRRSSFRRISFARSGSISGSTILADEEIHVASGDTLETVDKVTVRVGEALESPQLAELPRGVTVLVQFLSEEAQIIKVEAGNGICGWISTRAPAANKNSVVKVSMRRADEFEPGGVHEVKSSGLTMRDSEALDSDVISEMAMGTALKILEIGTMNRRRAKVQTQTGDQVGWVSLIALDGQILLGKMGQSASSSSDAATLELIEAARENHLPGVKAKLEGGGRRSFIGTAAVKCDVNASDVRGKTALIHAATCGNLTIVNYLLTRSGVEVNLADDSKRTALHHVARPTPQADSSSLVDCVQTLYEAKAHLEAVDHLGCTALLLAAQSGAAPVISALLQIKADLNRRDGSGRVAMEIAKQAGHGDEVLALLKQFSISARSSTDYWPAAGGFDYSASKSEEMALIRSTDVVSSKTLEDKPLLSSERAEDDTEETGETGGDGTSAKKATKLKRITVSRKSKKLPGAIQPDLGAVQVDEGMGDLRIDASLLAEDSTLESPSTDVIALSPAGDDQEVNAQSSERKVKTTRVVKKKSTKDLKSVKSPGCDPTESQSPEGVENDGDDKDSKDDGIAKRKSVVKRVAAKRQSKVAGERSLTGSLKLPDMPSQV